MTVEVADCRPKAVSTSAESHVFAVTSRTAVIFVYEAIARNSVGMGNAASH